MRFGIDYDGTWSEAPEMFEDMIQLIKSYGHCPVIITSRYEDDPVPVEGVEIHYTDGQPKVAWAAANDTQVDIWIDNNPYSLVKLRRRVRRNRSLSALPGRRR